MKITFRKSIPSIPTFNYSNLTGAFTNYKNYSTDRRATKGSISYLPGLENHMVRSKSNFVPFEKERDQLGNLLTPKKLEAGKNSNALYTQTNFADKEDVANIFHTERKKKLYHTIKSEQRKKHKNNISDHKRKYASNTIIGIFELKSSNSEVVKTESDIFSPKPQLSEDYLFKAINSKSILGFGFRTGAKTKFEYEKTVTDRTRNSVNNAFINSQFGSADNLTNMYFNLSNNSYANNITNSQNVPVKTMRQINENKMIIIEEKSKPNFEGQNNFCQLNNGKINSINFHKNNIPIKKMKLRKAAYEYDKLIIPSDDHKWLEQEKNLKKLSPTWTFSKLSENDRNALNFNTNLKNNKLVLLEEERSQLKSMRLQKSKIVQIEKKVDSSTNAEQKNQYIKSKIEDRYDKMKEKLLNCKVRKLKDRNIEDLQKTSKAVYQTLAYKLHKLSRLGKYGKPTSNDIAKMK